jgi:photosystem II stability/assembly factor-like uncharacterized protein
MDEAPAASRFSGRQWRALAIIAVALVIAALVGRAYYRSNPAPVPPSTPTPIAQLQVTPDTVEYKFVSPWVGWALDFLQGLPESAPGRFWIWKTSDGGQHWARQLTGEGGAAGFFGDSLQFFDKAHGFVFADGSPGQLFRTTNGGGRWESVKLPVASVGRIAFADARFGWLLSKGPNPSLYETRDAASNWKRLPDPPRDAIDLALRGPSEAYLGTVSGDGLHIYVSTDGGFSWQRRNLAIPGGGGGVALVRLPPDRGVIVRVDNQLWLTSLDFGASWWSAKLPNPGAEVGYWDALDWWAITGEILYKSSDAGQTWGRANGRPLIGQHSLVVMDAAHAWALWSTTTYTITGLVLTDDGGAHWTRALVPQPS